MIKLTNKYINCLLKQIYGSLKKDKIQTLNIGTNTQNDQHPVKNY